MIKTSKTAFLALLLVALAGPALAGEHPLMTGSLRGMIAECGDMARPEGAGAAMSENSKAGSEITGSLRGVITGSHNTGTMSSSGAMSEHSLMTGSTRGWNAAMN